nr:hypothetical protein [Micromonospora sp. DSM 115978]
MGAREDAVRASENPDWSGAEVEHAPPPRPAMTVHSVRLPREVSEWVEAEAERTGVLPSVVIRNLVERAARPTAPGETVTVRMDVLRSNLQRFEQDLTRAVEQAIEPAA